MKKETPMSFFGKHIHIDNSDHFAVVPVCAYSSIWVIWNEYIFWQTSIKIQKRGHERAIRHGYLKSIKNFWLHMRNDFSIQCPQNHSKLHSGILKWANSVEG